MIQRKVERNKDTNSNDYFLNKRTKKIQNKNTVLNYSLTHIMLSIFWSIFNKTLKILK